MTDDTVVTKPDTKTASEYVILRLNDAPGSEGRWDRVGTDTVTARSAEQAVRDTAAKRTKNDQNGTFVAVPRKSWKPLTVKAETVTTLKLEEVK